MLLARLAATGHLEHLALVGLDHQDDPRGKSDEAHEQGNDAPEAEAVHAGAQKSEGDHQANDEEDAKDHDGLGGVKAYEGPLIDE